MCCILWFFKWEESPLDHGLLRAHVDGGTVELLSMPLLLDGEVDGLHRDLVLLRRSLDVLVQLFVLDRLQTLPLAFPGRSGRRPRMDKLVKLDKLAKATYFSLKI